MFTWLRGTNKLRNAAFSTTYDTVWCAGPSIEGVNSIRPVKKVIEDFISDFKNQINYLNLSHLFQKCPDIFLNQIMKKLHKDDQKFQLVIFHIETTQLTY